MGDEIGNSSRLNEENLNQDELILQQQRQIEKEVDSMFVSRSTLYSKISSSFLDI